MPEINIAFNADASRFKNAVSEINQTVKQTFVDVRNSFSSVNNTFNSTNKTLNVMNNRFISINDTVQKSGIQWSRLADTTASIRNSFRIVTATFSTAANALSAPLAQFSRYEDAARRLAPLVGGMESAKAIADRLRDSAANGTMSFEQLASVAGRLASVFGSGDDVLKWTEAFHDLSAGTGLDVNELVGSFTKAKASGRFEAGFMDMFAQKGVNLYEPLAKELGMSEAALRAFAKTGELEFARIEKAILALTSGTGRFAGQAAAMSGTFSGSVGTMRENWNTLLAEFARPIAESLTPKIQAIAERLAECRVAAAAFGETLVGISPAAFAAATAFVGMKVATLALNAAMAANPATMLAVGLATLASLAGGAWTDALSEEEKAVSDLNAALLRLDAAMRKMEGAASAAELADAYRAAGDAVSDVSSAGTTLNTDLIYDNVAALRKKREAEIAAAEAADRHAEAQKRAAEAAKKGAELIADFEAGRKKRADEKELSAAPASERAGIFLRQKGYASADELRESVDFERGLLEANGGGSEKWVEQYYRPKIEALDRYEELLAAAQEEERKHAQTAAEAAARVEKANAAYAARKALLDAELAGNEKLRKSLEAVERVRALAGQYEAQGMSAEDAQARAAEIVAREDAVAARKDALRPVSTLGSGRVADDLAAVGGGRALNLGGSGENPAMRIAQNQLSVQQRMKELLARVAENTARAPSAVFAA